MPKITINGTIKVFFLKLQSAFWYFQTIAVSECCLIKFLPYILFEMGTLRSISKQSVVSVVVILSRHDQKSDDDV